MIDTIIKQSREVCKCKNQIFYMKRKQLNHTFGINIAGHITGDFGLAEAARSNIRAIKSAGISYALNNLNVVNGEYTDTTYTNFSKDNPYPVNLVVTNPNWLYEGVYNRRFDNFTIEYFKNKYNIGFWFWELPKFPSEWEFAFEFFDEIWTASGYVADAVSAVSPIPVLKIPLCLEINKPSLSRSELGLPESKFIFLFTFDFGSSFVRKNPLATIMAFQKAFGKLNHDVLLIVKFSNSHHYPAQRDELLDLIKDWSSIQIIEGHLPKHKIHGLIYNCDCYVSLHRAEGFGLGMAEAMFYGKPVIATAYSSNLDFMNVGNSFLVQYDLVTTTEDYGPYPTGSIWADASIDHATQLMQSVFSNYDHAQEIGTQAAKDIQSLLSPQAIGNRVKKRLEHLQIKTHDWNSLPPKNLVSKMLLEDMKAEKNLLETKIRDLKLYCKQAQQELYQLIIQQT